MHVNFFSTVYLRLIIQLLFLTIICLVFLPAQTAFANDDNLILNPSFESNSLSPWNVNAWDGASMQFSTSTPGSNGLGQSAKIRVLNNPASVILRQSVAIKGGETYRASVWLKASEATTVHVIVRQNSPHWTVRGLKTAQVGTEWELFTFDLASPDDNLARIEFALTELDVDVFIDEVSLLQTSTQGVSDSFSVDNTKIIPPTFMGMHMNKGHVVDLWPTLADVSPGLIRLWDTGTDWLGVEQAKGVFDWVRTDLYIQRIKQSLPDSKIMYTFGRVPDWANGGQGISKPPSNMANWRDFVSAIVDRHGSNIDYYELWNEFDYGYFWSGTQQEMLEMATILKEVVTEKDPTAVILTPNITTNGLARLSEYLALGGGELADAVSIHIYAPDSRIENSFVFPAVIRSILNQADLADMPIYNTEGAVTIEEDSSLTPTQMRSYVARYYLLNWLAGLETAGWYFWENDPSMSRLPLVSDSGTYASLTAGGVAYKSTREWLVGSKLTSHQTSQETDVYRLYLDLDNGQKGMIAWTTATTTQTIVAPTGVKESRQLDGSVTVITDTSITINQEPILIIYETPIPTEPTTAQSTTKSTSGSRGGGSKNKSTSPPEDTIETIKKDAPTSTPLTEEARIIELQKRLIGLLTELISLLQKQIALQNTTKRAN